LDKQWHQTSRQLDEIEKINRSRLQVLAWNVGRIPANRLWRKMVMISLLAENGDDIA
jgi:hypothetical protein